MQNNIVKILFVGDIVGKPARDFLHLKIPKIRREKNIDLVVANAENVAGGSGITEKTARELFLSEIDLITLGDHSFKKKEAEQVLSTMDVIRPLNYGDAAPGRGYIIKEKKIGSQKIRFAVINLLGRVFMQPVDCPFKAVRTLLETISSKADIIIVDMHAEATSEKMAMGYFLAGKVSAVIGTHTHIPTSDEKIIDQHTAYITDVGMAGSLDSILGRKKEDVIEKFLTNTPVRFNVAENEVGMQGVIVDIDFTSGKAVSIERVLAKS